MSGQILKQLREEVRSTPSLSLSGMVVIAIGKPDDHKDGLRPCQVAVEVKQERPIAKENEKKGKILTARSSGWVRDFEEIELSGGQCDIKSKDGKKSRLFDFDIVPSGKASTGGASSK